MVDRDIYFKRLRRVVTGIYFGSLSVLGWALAGLMSPNSQVWWIVIPIIIFITIPMSFAIQAWVFEGE